MTKYTFSCVIGTDVLDAGPTREFEDVADARAEARALIGKLAARALETRDIDMLSVEIFDESRNPVTELRLVFEEIPK